MRLKSETPKALSSLLLLTSFFLMPTRGKATVLTFEDLPNPANESLPVPDGYGGITWSTGNWQYYAEAQPPYSPHSGTNRIFSYNADNVFSFSGSRAIFTGAWFAGGSGTNDRVTFQLYLSGSLVATSQSLYLTDTSTFLASGYSGLVDAVRISESPVVRPADTDFVMDDVSFQIVPEPLSTGLVSMGLLSVMVLKRGARSKR